jgi:hypothetical protein
VFPKYREFADQVYDILEVEGAGNKEQLTEFLDTIGALTCEGWCWDSDVKRVKKAIIGASRTSGGFNETWYKCIEKRARPLRKEEVQVVFDRIKQD